MTEAQTSIERRRGPTTAEIMRKLDHMQLQIDRLSKDSEQLTANMRLLGFAWGLDLSDPKTVADAMSARLKLRDAQRLGMVLLGSGLAGLIMAGLAVLNWLKSN